MPTHPYRPDKPGPLLPTLLGVVSPDLLARATMMADEPPPPPAGTPPAEPPKAFDQAAVDRIVADRLARDRATRSDYDDLKKAAKELEDLKAAGATEQEKAIAAARKEAETAARSDERSKADTRILRAEVKALAGARFADPGDALRLVDLTGLKVDDSGDVDEKAITARLDQLLKDKPYLAAGAGNGNGGGLGNLGQGQRTTTSGQRGDKGRAEAERRYGKKPEPKHSST